MNTALSRRIGRRSVIYAVLLSLLTATLVAVGGPPLLTHTQAAKADVTAGEIVFDDYSTWHIKVRDASGSSITDIGPGYYPDVSPDGSRIAFITSAGDSSGSQTLHVMNSDGSNATELVPRDTASDDNGSSSTTHSNPSWSPDGQWIVFNRVINRGGDGNYYQIDKVRADGTGLSTVTYVVYTSSSSHWDSNPVWSPSKDGSDGSYRIAFVAIREVTPLRCTSSTRMVTTCTRLEPLRRLWAA